MLMETCEGDYQNDMRHGRGIYRFADGATYEGYWNNGKKHGLGHLSFSNGNSFNGSFDNDKMRSGVFRSVAHKQGVSSSHDDDIQNNNSPCEYRAEFTGGDDIINGFRMYRVKLYTVSEGELFKDCSFSNGQLVE